MNYSNLTIVGRPRSERQNMTSLFLEKFPGARRVDGTPPVVPLDLQNDAVIFASSKERFPEILEHCCQYKRTLIIVSSGIELPEGFVPRAPVIKAPNLALLVCALFEVLPKLGDMAKILGAKTSVVEAHQASKTSPAVTASKFAAMFGVPEEKIGHIRSDAVAGAVLDVPENHYGGFAQHIIATSAAGVKVTIRMEILGRDAYADGLALLLKRLQEGDSLPVGVHDAHTLVFG